MSRTISEPFPLLNRLENALINEYVGMTDREIMKLNMELQKITERNCSHIKYDIAKSIEPYVSAHCKNLLNTQGGTYE